MKKNISASIINKIKDEKIEQHSKFYFLAKFSLILVGGLIFLVIGIIASGVIWHFFHDTELLEIFHIEKVLFIKSLLLSFPIFWVIVSILLGTFASYFAKNTRKGYKISLKTWFVAIILFQIAGGLALEQSPIGERLEHRMTRSLQIMKSREGKFQELWQNPEKGMLIGEIAEIEKGRIILNDLENKEWEVSFGKESVRGQRLLKEADKIRIIGEKTGDLQFSAKKIFGRRFDFKRPPPPRALLDKMRELRRKGQAERPFLRERKREEIIPDLRLENLRELHQFKKEQLGF